jgi:uncharacterized protein YndB with AHSA1/START domain
VSVNRAQISATPDEVWQVLADGWLYPLWVVGATRMRAVDDDWPAVGSRIHHSVGVWPLVLNDETRVLDREPGRRLVLRASAWPTAGDADVSIELEPTGRGTAVEMREDVVAGPGALVPAPLRRPAIAWRNAESLKRLTMLAEGRPVTTYRSSANRSPSRRNPTRS